MNIWWPILLIHIPFTLPQQVDAQAMCKEFWFFPHTQCLSPRSTNQSTPVTFHVWCYSHRVLCGPFFRSHIWTLRAAFSRSQCTALIKGKKRFSFQQLPNNTNLLIHNNSSPTYNMLQQRISHKGIYIWNLGCNSFPLDYSVFNCMCVANNQPLNWNSL